MGAVYLGRDLQTGARVGIKCVHEGEDNELSARFWREAHALSSLRHPGIVGYFAHGLTATGKPYLIMEWLDGDDLREILSRRALGVGETLRLGIRLCKAVTAAHQSGIVHRDIKPGNILVPGGNVENAKLVDFGLVQMTTRGEALTTVGAVVGTPSFMAPEQARGLASIDQRADLYSIGALLFACLTQRPPFIGDHAIAILAKVLYDEAPRLSEFRDDIPETLDALIAELLAKDPKDRPSETGGVSAALSTILDSLGEAEQVASSQLGVPAITAGEQRFLTVLMVEGHAGDRRKGRRQVLARYALKFGAKLDQLADGTIAGVFSEGGKPHDMAIRAAQCALAIRAELDVDTVILATGRGIAQGRLPVGQVIDRAVSLLMGNKDTIVSDIATRETEDVSHLLPLLDSTGVIVDEVTAGFLDRRFELAELSPRRFELVGRRKRSNDEPPLLGVTTECVGRKREFASLDGILDECLDEHIARGALVTAEPGVGKSRLCREFLRRVADGDGDIAVWTGRGDWLRSGASFSLLSEVIRDAMGLPEGQAGGDLPGRIAKKVAEVVTPEHVDRVAAFLGELMGIPFPGAGRVQLEAARQDPKLMHDQTQRAFLDWLTGAVTCQPVLIVIDDLQWGDRPTIRFIEAAMRTLREQPLMVLALARPEVHELFPGLFEGRAFEEIRLRPLSRRACRKLIAQVLGAVETEPVDDVILDRLAEHCGGNAFYLEELIRNVAAGNLNSFPATVLAMTEARLDALPPDERRVLRAASVFGRRFWWSSVAALLGDALKDFEIDLYLYRLVEREFIVEQPSSRFPDQAEFLFSHALFREATYGMLTEEDRARGHLSAGVWLEQAGELDSSVLAEHFQRGGALERAIEWYLRSAKQALDANDVEAVLRCVEQASECGASGETLGALKLLEAEAYNWRSESELARACSRQAISLLPAGGSDWASAIHHFIWASTMTGSSDETTPLVHALVVHATPDADALYITSMANCAPGLAVVGQTAQARTLEAAIQGICVDDTAPMIMASVARMRSFLAYMNNEFDRACDLMLEAAQHWQSIGNERSSLIDLGNAGTAQLELGEYAHAADTLSTAVRAAERAGLNHLIDTNKANWALALAHIGQTQVARQLCNESLAALDANPAPRHEVIVRTYLAQIQLMDDDADAALENTDIALPLAEAWAGLRAFVLGVRSRALLRLDRPQEAFHAARDGMLILRELDTIECGESILRLAYAEALLSTDDQASASDAIREAHARLITRAEHICDPTRRQSFFDSVPEHARTFALRRDLIHP